jgi:hypothetical protein
LFVRKAPEIITGFADESRLYTLARIYDGRLDAAIAFTLLAGAQATGAIASMSEGRVAFTSYVATGILTSASFAILAHTAVTSRRLPALPPPIVIPGATDLMAVASSLAAAVAFRGPARLFSAMFTLAFASRAAGVALLPSDAVALLIVGGEALRALASASLALVYAYSSARAG